MMKKYLKLKERAERMAMEAKAKLAAKERGDGFVDSAFRILIAVVIGALLLFGIYTIMDDTVLPSLTSKITSIFSQTPSGS